MINETMLITNEEYMNMLDLIDAQKMLIQKYKNYIELLETIKIENSVVR